jgi:hypothetical protein
MPTPSSAPPDHLHNHKERTSAHRHVRASTRATSLGLRVPAYTNDLVRGARVRSSWVTFEPSSATSGSRQLHRQRAPPLE